MSIDTKNVAIFAGSASLELATKIAEGLGISLGDMEVEHFADGEFSVYYKDSIRGKDVFLVQPSVPPLTTSQPSSLTSDGHVRTARTSLVSPSVPSSWQTSSAPLESPD